MPVIRFVREGRDVECYPGENLRDVHITEIFARITLHITPFTDESDHGHGQHQLKQDTIVSPGISFCNRNEAEARLTPGAMSKGQHRLR